MDRNQIFDAEPTDRELAAIEDEWPVIEAELAELECVIRIVAAAQEPSETDVRRYRRAQRRVLREMRVFLSLHSTSVPSADVA